MHILGIDASPRNGNSTFALSKLSELCSNHHFESVKLSDLRIECCNGCLACEDDEETFCVIQDDMSALYPKIINADFILIATPIYMNNLPGNLKTFFDRLNHLCEKLGGKRFAFVAVGQLDGEDGQAAMVRMQEVFDDLCGIFGLDNVGSIHLHGRSQNDLQERGENLAATLMDFVKTITRGV